MRGGLIFPAIPLLILLAPCAVAQQSDIEQVTPQPSPAIAQGGGPHARQAETQARSRPGEKACSGRRSGGESPPS